MALFSTVTNVNFDAGRVMELVQRGLELKRGLLEQHAAVLAGFDHPMARVAARRRGRALRQKAYEVGVLFSNPDEGHPLPPGRP